MSSNFLLSYTTVIVSWRYIHNTELKIVQNSDHLAWLTFTQLTQQHK